MVSVVREIEIRADASECWAAVKDFGALHERLAPGFVTACRLVGPREREVTFLDGSVAQEYLVGVEDERKRFAYTMTTSPLPSTHFNASVEILDEGEGKSRLVWIVDVLPDDLEPIIGGIMDLGLPVMRTTLEAASSS